MIPDASKFLPFLPPLDKRTVWEILVGFSSFGFFCFVLWFFTIADNASAADVEEIHQKVNNLILESKEERISERHRDFCLAVQGSDQAQYYLQRRNMLIREYNEVARDNYDVTSLPNCDVLRPEEGE